jgi:Zn-dependent protease with chaperone function
MTREHRTWFLRLFLGLTLVCLFTAGPHQMTNDLMGVWSMCCRGVKTVLASSVAFWLVFAARTLVIALLVASAAMLVRRLWWTHRLMATLHTAIAAGARADLPPRLTTLCAHLGIAHPIVLLTNSAPLAFCFGLRKPGICLSTGLLDTLSNKELKAVLLHEAHHCRHFDPLRTFLVDLLAALFFFLPVASEWCKFFAASTELAADRYAIRLAGRFSLAGALHKLLTYRSPLPFPAGVGGVSRFSTLDARLTQLLGDSRMMPRLSHRSLVSSSLLLILGCFLLQIALL